MWEPLTGCQEEEADAIVEDFLYALEAVKTAHHAGMVPKESYESITGWLAETTVQRLAWAEINIHAYQTSGAETVGRWTEALDALDSEDEVADLVRDERRRVRRAIRDDAKTPYKPRRPKS